MAASHESLLDLSRSFAAVGELIDNIEPEQWSGATPCADWSVRQVVSHLVGMNRVFVALLAEEPPPHRDDLPENDLGPTYWQSATTLLTAFGQPGALVRSYGGPLGTATGAERLQIRLYDLLAHGWDIAQATGQPARLPEDVAERSLAFAQRQVSEQARPGRFDRPQVVSNDASYIERLVAFLGRPVHHG